MMHHDRVRVTVDAHVAHVQLARPDKMNAIDHAMIEGMVAAGDQVRGDPSVRAVVLSGEGRSFCAGLDLDMIRSTGAGNAPSVDLSARTHAGMNVAQYAVMQWRLLPVPVIVAVQGAAFGGGCQVCLGPDMRIVHPEAKLSLMEAKWGLIPDMGGFFLVKELVRRDLAAEIIHTARVLSGTEAHALGLATRVDEDPLTAALAIARQIAAQSPHAIRAGKRMLSLNDEAIMVDMMTREAAEQTALLGSRNQREAVRAGMTKTEAQFVDPVT